MATTTIESKDSKKAEQQDLMPPALSSRQRAIKEAMKLVRIRVSCMNPQKADLPGEIVTVANATLSAKKYVPLKGDAAQSWHVPHCIYEQLRDAQFLQIVSRDGGEQVQAKMVPEYSIELLPPLSAQEIERIATAQLRAAPDAL